MAWERRGNKSFYYRKVKVGGKVRSIYVGSEEIAGPLVQERAELREKEQQRIAEFWQHMAIIDAAIAKAAAAREQIETLLWAALLSAGLHRTKHAVWRRRYAKRTQK